MAKGGKFVLVLLESLAGTGHRFAAVRPKLGDKLEKYRFDPWVRQWVVYREKKKLKSLRS